MRTWHWTYLYLLGRDKLSHNQVICYGPLYKSYYRKTGSSDCTKRDPSQPFYDCLAICLDRWPSQYCMTYADPGGHCVEILSRSRT